MATVSSSFDGSENPLSESGAWAAVTNWGEVEKVSGYASATTKNVDSARKRVSSGIGSNQYCEIITTAQSLTQNMFAGAACRIQADGSCYLFTVQHKSNGLGAWNLDYVDNTLTFTHLEQGTTGSFAFGQPIRIECDGTTITGWINGTKVTADNTHSTLSGGDPGIQLYNQPNDTTAVKIDSFEAGDLAAGQSSTPPVLAATPAFPVSTSFAMSSSPSALAVAPVFAVVVAFAAAVTPPNLEPTPDLPTPGREFDYTSSPPTLAPSPSFPVSSGSFSIETDPGVLAPTPGLPLPGREQPAGSQISSSFDGSEDPLSEGGNWTTPGSWTGLKKVSGVVRVKNNAADCFARWIGASIGDDYSAEIEIAEDVSGLLRWMGICARSQTDGSCYVAMADPENGRFRITKVTAPSTFNTLEETTGLTIGLGDKIKIEVSGADPCTIKGYLDTGSGYSQIGNDQTDSDYDTGPPQLFLYNNSSVESRAALDNFVATGTGGGNESTPPVLAPTPGFPIAATFAASSSPPVFAATPAFPIAVSFALSVTPPVFGVAPDIPTPSATTGTTGEVTPPDLAPTPAFPVTAAFTASSSPSAFAPTPAFPDPSVSSGSNSVSSSFDGSENPLSEGGNWTTANSTWAALKKLNGTVHQTSVGIDGLMRWVGAGVGNDYRVQITISHNSGSLSRWVGVAARVQSTGECYTFKADLKNQRTRISLDTGDDTGTTIQEITGLTIGVGDILALEVEGVAPNIKLRGYLNGGLIGTEQTRNDPTLDSGQGGIFQYNGSTDDLRVGLDDYSATSLASPTETTPPALSIAPAFPTPPTTTAETTTTPPVLAPAATIPSPGIESLVEIDAIPVDPGADIPTPSSDLAVSTVPPVIAATPAFPVVVSFEASSSPSALAATPAFPEPGTQTGTTGEVTPPALSIAPAFPVTTGDFAAASSPTLLAATPSFPVVTAHEVSSSPTPLAATPVFPEPGTETGTVSNVTPPVLAVSPVFLGVASSDVQSTPPVLTASPAFPEPGRESVAGATPPVLAATPVFPDPGLTTSSETTPPLLVVSPVFSESSSVSVSATPPVLDPTPAIPSAAVLFEISEPATPISIAPAFPDPGLQGDFTFSVTPPVLAVSPVFVVSVELDPLQKIQEQQKVSFRLNQRFKVYFRLNQRRKVRF